MGHIRHVSVDLVSQQCVFFIFALFTQISEKLFTCDSVSQQKRAHKYHISNPLDHSQIKWLIKEIYFLWC